MNHNIRIILKHSSYLIMIVVAGLSVFITIQWPSLGLIILSVCFVNCIITLASENFRKYVPLFVRILVCIVNIGLLFFLVIQYIYHKQIWDNYHIRYEKTRILINVLDKGLSTYLKREGELPGRSLIEGGTASHDKITGVIIAALVNKDIMVFSKHDVWITDGNGALLHEASKYELINPDLPKAILDFWDNPIVMNFNLYIPEKKVSMRNPDFVDIYSKGVNRQDNTKGTQKHTIQNDDIGNWNNM